MRTTRGIMPFVEDSHLDCNDHIRVADKGTESVHDRECGASDWGASAVEIDESESVSKGE